MCDAYCVSVDAANSNSEVGVLILVNSTLVAQQLLQDNHPFGMPFSRFAWVVPVTFLPQLSSCSPCCLPLPIVASFLPLSSSWLLLWDHPFDCAAVVVAGDFTIPISCGHLGTVDCMGKERVLVCAHTCCWFCCVVLYLFFSFEGKCIEVAVPNFLILDPKEVSFLSCDPVSCALQGTGAGDVCRLYSRKIE